MITVSTFYKFVAIDDCEALKAALAEQCVAHDIKGTILLAHEGLNATVSGSADGMAALLSWLRRDPRFADLESKESCAETHPFGRMKIKIKREIVTFGVTVDVERGTGSYVVPEAWNALISDPDVIVVDTRNAYEFDVGTFAGARNPNTHAFREFPAYVKAELADAKDKKIAMFCTGGIRCEKATAYLKSEGFSDVYHLRGGILKYLETIPEAESLWRGECFVFDERVALEHGVREGHYGLCPSCGYPIRAARNEDGGGETDVRCPQCAN